MEIIESVDPLAGAHCTGCGRHCPLSAPGCPRGLAQADRAIARSAQARSMAREDPDHRRIYDTLEEAEEAADRIWRHRQERRRGRIDPDGQALPVEWDSRDHRGWKYGRIRGSHRPGRRAQACRRP